MVPKVRRSLSRGLNGGFETFKEVPGEGGEGVEQGEDDAPRVLGGGPEVDAEVVGEGKHGGSQQSGGDKGHERSSNEFRRSRFLVPRVGPLGFRRVDRTLQPLLVSGWWWSP